MGIQKTVTLAYTCDKCGEEIERSEVFSGITKTFGYFMDGTKDYQINVELQIPYQEKTVVCKDCALEILKQGVKQLEGE
nr:MAG TPA: RimK-related lysine biosynthesis protein, Probable-dependent amine/thiol ligase family Amino-group [Caudoviricetes sp.]